MSDQVLGGLRRDNFPIFKNHPTLAYLDNGATTQKPQAVIDAISRFYEEDYATIHRGVYKLSQAATALWDETRRQVADFVGAGQSHSVIFTKGTTEGLNLVASAYGTENVNAEQIILVSGMEHHSNIVPWQELARRVGAQLKTIPVLDDGQLDMASLEDVLTSDVAIVALTQVSNVLGTVNPIGEIVEKAHRVGAVVVVDGAQAIAHMPVNVQTLDADFYAFSSHKMYGPTGVGVLVLKNELLPKMSAYQTGGDMIESVAFEGSRYLSGSQKYEAGTPAIAEVVGLGAAIRYIRDIGFDVIQATEKKLLTQATTMLARLPGLRLIGEAPGKAAVQSFVIDGIHPHDLGTILDESNVAIRAGHHCAQPLMRRYGVPATARLSLSFYNTTKEIRQCQKGLERALEIFK